MMDRYKIYNAKELAHIEAVLNKALVSWAEDWLLSSVKLTRLVNAHQAPGDLTGIGLQTASDFSNSAVAESIRYISDELLRHSIAEAIVPADLDIDWSRSQIIQDAILAARDDFVSTFVDGSVSSMTNDLLSLSIWQSGSGWLVALIAFETQEIPLLISPAGAEYFLADLNKSQTLRKPINGDVNLAELLATQSVDVKAQLCEVRLSVKEVKSLAVGDVITTDVAVTDEVSLLGAADKKLAGGKLVQINNRKAIQLNRQGGENHE